MPNYTFGITTAKDFFLEKLIIDYKLHQQDRYSLHSALNCAMSCVHMIDWLYNDASLSLPYMQIEDFRRAIIARCLPLQLMHDLANGSKHLNITRPKSAMKDTFLHMGVYTDEYSGEFDTSDFVVELNAGEELIFDQELEKVITFWKNYFQHDLGIPISTLS